MKNIITGLSIIFSRRGRVVVIDYTDLIRLRRFHENVEHLSNEVKDALDRVLRSPH